MTNICAVFFFGKNCANTETRSFADMCRIRILDEGNTFFTGTTLIRTSTLQTLIFPCTSSECLT